MPPKKGKMRAEPDVTVPEGDAGAGRGIFDSQCGACHALEGDNKTAAAPMLGGLFGRMSGATTFKYSNSMKKANILWSEKHLFMFLKNPGKYVTGTKMAFAGWIPKKTEPISLLIS